MPKVTIIIPSYNHAKFIAKTIQSVLDQTFQDFELLIRDDGSQDNSVEIIKSFVDPRIKLFVNPHNMGACYTVNTMIGEAQGKYIALLNSDDKWMPYKLEKQVCFLDENPNYVAVFSHAIIIDENEKHIKHPFGKVFTPQNWTSEEWLNHFFTKYNCWCHPSLLIRRSVYNNVGLYNPLMAALPDFEMWVKICLRYEIYILQEPLVKFRILNQEKNASSLNPRNLRAFNYEIKKIFDLYLILDLNKLNKIFNTNYPSIEEAHFNLAAAAINNPNKLKSQIEWGFDIIYNLMNQGKLLNHISYIEFNDLIKDHDIYAFIERNNVFYKTYSLIKRFKKFFFKY